MVKKGSVIYLTYGDYGDYTVDSCFIVVAEFSIKDKKAEWITNCKKTKPICSLAKSMDKVIAFDVWLTKQGLIKPVDSIELWVD